MLQLQFRNRIALSSCNRPTISKARFDGAFYIVNHRGYVMTQEEQDNLFTQLLHEYQALFADMDQLSRTLWFAINEENELMSFIVGSGETPDQALPRFKVKLLAIAAALESLPCAAAEQRNIAELRHTAMHVSAYSPTESAIPEGEDYLSQLNRMTPDELSQHADELFRQALEELRSEGAI